MVTLDPLTVAGPETMEKVTGNPEEAVARSEMGVVLYC